VCDFFVVAYIYLLADAAVPLAHQAGVLAALPPLVDAADLQAAQQSLIVAEAILSAHPQLVRDKTPAPIHADFVLYVFPFSVGHFRPARCRKTDFLRQHCSLPRAIFCKVPRRPWLFLSSARSPTPMCRASRLVYGLVNKCAGSGR
jgi:hypothetical protein